MIFSLGFAIIFFMCYNIEDFVLGSFDILVDFLGTERKLKIGGNIYVIKIRKTIYYERICTF